MRPWLTLWWLPTTPFDASAVVETCQKLNANFMQVFALDSDFELLLRAWCVAELVLAHVCGIP